MKWIHPNLAGIRIVCMTPVVIACRPRTMWCRLSGGSVHLVIPDFTGMNIEQTARRTPSSSCVKVEVAVLDSPSMSLKVLTVSVDVKQLNSATHSRSEGSWTFQSTCVEKNLSTVHRVTDPYFFYFYFFKSTFNFSQTVGEMLKRWECFQFSQ